MVIYKKAWVGLPAWVWIISVISIFLCILTYSESAIYGSSRTLSFWSSWASNINILAYTFELIYIFAITISFIRDEKSSKRGLFYYAIGIFKRVALYSIMLLVIIFVMNLLAYFYASLVNNAPVNFINEWPQGLEIGIIVSPLVSGIAMSFIVFIRILLAGLIMVTISEFFYKKSHFGVAIVSLVLFFIGFDVVSALKSINIFPFQYANPVNLSFIYKDAPISLSGVLLYFIIAIPIAFGLLLLGLKYGKRRLPKMIRHTSTFSEDIRRILMSINFWGFAVLISMTMPFLYFCLWGPEKLIVDVNAFKLFNEIYVPGNYLLNFILPMLSVGVYGFRVWDNIKSMMETGTFTKRDLFRQLAVASIASGASASIGVFGAIGLSFLIAPSAPWNWGFTLLFILRVFLASGVFSIVGLGILLLSKSRVAAMTLPVLYTNYALGGLYHIAGTDKAVLFHNIVPMFRATLGMEGPFQGYLNLFSLAVVATMLLCVWYINSGEERKKIETK